MLFGPVDGAGRVIRSSPVAGGCTTGPGAPRRNAPAGGVGSKVGVSDCPVAGGVGGNGTIGPAPRGRSGWRGVGSGAIGWGGAGKVRSHPAGVFGPEHGCRVAPDV
jgi:hypothetical protein